jgi:branched-chain amino acid transport system permease protein
LQETRPIPAAAADRASSGRWLAQGASGGVVIYRENGQFKTSYQADGQIFPIRQDRVAMLIFVAFIFIGVPLLASDYLFLSIINPFLILALAAIGLNLLVGYCGQISLGTAAFMSVGAYTAYNLMVRIPGMNLIAAFLLAGGVAMCFGVLFGIPSLRIRGLYLAVATLAAQFFADWAFQRIGWLTNYSASGSVSVPPIEVFGWVVNTPVEKYLFCLGFVVVFALMAKNLVRGHMGRTWMAMRDMDVAAEVIGIRPVYAKLTAFAVSSFFVGVAGALWAFVHLGSWEPAAFDINRSLNLLFMVIIGGLGSILGSFLGAAFIVILPIALSQVPGWLGIYMSVATAAHLEAMIFGSLIVFFLIVEPHGLARLWSIGKEKLRMWPFPY